MNHNGEGGDKQCGTDMDGAWRASSYRTSFDTRTWQGRNDGAIFVTNFPPDMRKRICRRHLRPLEVRSTGHACVPFSHSLLPRAVGFSERDSS
jgi:hypothetical protein